MKTNLPPEWYITRRGFLQWVGMTTAGAILAACAPKSTSPEAFQPKPAAATMPAAPPSSAPSPQAPTATSLPPTASPEIHTAVPTQTPSPTLAPLAVAAVGQADTYDSVILKRELSRMLDDLGGISDLVQPGARVAIKTNLTGGTWWDAPDKPLSTEYFVTHPAVVGALAELLLDAGAGKVWIVDGLGDTRNFDVWGYTTMAAPLHAHLVDLCQPKPYQDFSRFAVQPSLVFSHFYLNTLLSEIDLLVSVAKLKCHSVGGVTMSLKNLFGLTPIHLYRNAENDNNRSALHGDSQFDTRLPRVIVDLNRACRVHLALIDGVMTAEGGAGPWDAGMAQVKPGLLAASKDPVACDAVGTALMGLDPQAASGTLPFTHCENYLELAANAGLGIHRLDQIGIKGPSISSVAYPFKPAG